MDLGTKIKKSRLEAGLSQRQLCGDVITRNMLSQIENGAARPSMDTLRYLAQRLGKTVSYFLDEQTVTSPNQEVMAKARRTFHSRACFDVLEILNAYQAPDPVFDSEYGMLRVLCLMEGAEQAIRENRLPYAESLLEQAKTAGQDTPYYTPELERRRLLLLAQASPTRIRDTAAALPKDDPALLIRARAALEQEKPDRAAAYLDAAEDQTTPEWTLLRGEACFSQGHFSEAAIFFHRAETDFPQLAYRRLEICYRELGDFQRAYEYACKQR